MNVISDKSSSVCVCVCVSVCSQRLETHLKKKREGDYNLDVCTLDAFLAASDCHCHLVMILKLTAIIPVAFLSKRDEELHNASFEPSYCFGF